MTGSAADAAWRTSAACTDTDPDVFFPLGDNIVPDEAQDVCFSCPVSTECLEFALAHPTIHGVWAATNVNDRNRIRRRRRRLAAR